MLEKLKPCPFCGGEVEIINAEDLTINGKCYNAVTNIGIRPTYKTDKVGCETYIKDFDGDIYGKQMKLQLLRFVREEQKFNSLEELKSAILKDVNLL